MTITEFLKSNVPFLAGLTEDQVAYLAQRVEQNSFKKGQTIIFKGVSVEGLHVVAQGKASVHVKPPKGQATVKVAELAPGDVFGETSILDFCMAGATIRCEADDTLVFVIPQTAFLKLLQADPDLEKRTRELIEARKTAQSGQKKPA